MVLAWSAALPTRADWITCQSSSTTEIARRPERLSERKPAFYGAEPRAPSTMTDKRYTGDGIYCRGHNSSETVRVSVRQMGLIELPLWFLHRQFVLTSFVRKLLSIRLSASVEVQIWIHSVQNKILWPFKRELTWTRGKCTNMFISMLHLVVVNT